LGLQALEVAQAAEKGALDAGLIAGEGGERGGVVQFVAEAEGQPMRGREICQAPAGAGFWIGALQVAVAGFEVTGAAETPGGNDDLLEDEFFERADGVEVAGEGLGKSVEFLRVLGIDDDVGGGEAVLEGVEADAGFALGGAGAGAFLGIAAIGVDLFFSCHKIVEARGGWGRGPLVPLILL
jgi:hypothetical protein